MTEPQLQVGTGEQPVPATLDGEPHVSVALTFRGYCDTCPWEGKDRANNLTALRDFETHAATSIPHALGFDWRAARDDEELEDPA